MIKLAMVKIHRAFKENRFQSKMILQVHDELVFDVVKEEAERVKPVILDCMQSAMVLPNGIPILAEVGEGENWLEAH
jgi:DNA polymerase-1